MYGDHFHPAQPPLGLCYRTPTTDAMALRFFVRWLSYLVTHHTCTVSKFNTTAERRAQYTNIEKNPI
ncbi:hypothetical protein BaRGS_00031750, partial [Batillaria attramentaria]